MNVLKKVLFTTILFIASVNLFSQTEYVEKKPNQFIDDFTEINKVVREKYTHLERKHINIDSLFLVYSEKVKTAKTNDEYKNLLLAYFAELKNGHSGVLLSPTYYIDCSAILVNPISNKTETNGLCIKKDTYS